MTKGVVMTEEMKTTLKRMQVLRDNMLLEGKIDDKNLDVYGFLSSRLGQALLADRAFAQLVRQINRRIDNALLFYDPRQSGYWEEKAPGVLSALDNILLRIKKDEFDSIEDRHHILQAIKYSNIDDIKSMHRNDPQLLQSIRPAHGAVPDNAKQGWLERTFGILLGATYTTEQQDLQTWRVRGSAEYVRDVIEEAKNRGYSTVLFDVKHNATQTLISKLENAGYEGLRVGRPASKENSVFANSENDTVEVTIEHQPLVRAPNPLPTFEKILEIVPSPEAENSLELAPGNYYTYGHAFIECVMDRLPKDAVIVKPAVDKENSLVIFDQTVEIGPYTRSSKLYCSAGIRKIITAITEKPQHDRMLDFALSERTPLTFNIDGKKYVRYRAFGGGQAVDKEEF